MSYIANSHITHNGVEYPKGHEVPDLNKAEAAILIKDGVIVDTSTGAPAPAKATGTKPLTKKQQDAANKKALNDAKKQQAADAKAAKEKAAADKKAAAAAKKAGTAPATPAADPAAGL